jgi:SAM-dependent methyltransferase
MKSFYSTNKFDYEIYKQAQIAKNIAKINNIWILPQEMKQIVEYLRNRNPTKGIDHGARNNFFAKQIMEKLPGLEVVGTDISPTIKDFDGIEWDMTSRNEEWVNKFDFVYSNSVDHCPDFNQVFNILFEQVKQGGILMLHLDFDHQKIDEADCTALDSIFIKEFLKQRELEYQVLKVWDHRPIFIICK